jgi:hypothetical protein
MQSSSGSESAIRINHATGICSVILLPHRKIAHQPDAMQKLQRWEQENQVGHVIGHVKSTDASSIPPTSVKA